jgi:hypothetical protein
MKTTLVAIMSAVTFTSCAPAHAQKSFFDVNLPLKVDVPSYQKNKARYKEAYKRHIHTTHIYFAMEDLVDRIAKYDVFDAVLTDSGGHLCWKIQYTRESGKQSKVLYGLTQYSSGDNIASVLVDRSLFDTCSDAYTFQASLKGNIFPEITATTWKYKVK